MKLQRLSYTVTAEVSFTPDEADYLVKRAKVHYDGTCQAARFLISEGAFENGFLAQLKLFPGPVNWSFRNFDLTLKILELRGRPEDQLMRLTIHTALNRACDLINKRYEELTKEEALVQR